MANDHPPLGAERLSNLLGRIFYVGPALVVIGLLLAIALPGSSGWGVGGGLCGCGVMLTVAVPWERKRLRRLFEPSGKAESDHP
jgi:hypothetical protein